MNCPTCNRPVPEAAAVCPHCAAPLRGQSAAVMSRRRTVTDVIEGVLFLALGLALLILGGWFFSQSVGPAIDAITGTPSASHFFEAVWVIDARFYTVPVILYAFSTLMWALAGVVLIFGGIFSLAKGRGGSQATAAVVLMLFGLFSDLAAVFVLNYSAIEATGLAPGVMELVAAGWLNYLVQLVLIAFVLVLALLKRRARRKLRYEKAVRRNRQRTAIYKAATAVQPAPGTAPQPRPPQDPNPPQGGV